VLQKIRLNPRLRSVGFIRVPISPQKTQKISQIIPICVPNEKPPRPSATPPKEEKTKKEIRLNPRLRSIRLIRVPILTQKTQKILKISQIISICVPKITLCNSVPISV
jgi:hypothetical protein